MRPLMREDEEPCQAAEARYRAVFDSAQEGLVVIGRTGRIVALNPAAQRIFGYAPAELTGRRVHCLVDTRHLDHSQSQVRYLLFRYHLDVSGEAIFYGRRKDGARVTLAVTLNPIALDDEWAVVLAVRDFEKLERIGRHVEAGTSAIRHRVTRHLRDELGQDLTAVMYLSNRIRAELRSMESDAPRQAEELTNHIHNILHKLRRFMRDLTPVSEGPASLQIALAQLIEEFRHRWAADFSLQCSEAMEVRRHDTAVQLYHIARETLDALATQYPGAGIHVRLMDRGDKGVLRISADLRRSPDTHGALQAQAFDLPDTARHRADLLGAAIQTHTRSEETFVSCRFPNEQSEG